MPVPRWLPQRSARAVGYGVPRSGRVAAGSRLAQSRDRDAL